MRFITDFADLAVLFPLALCVGAALALAGWRRGALGWALAVGGALGAMLALKLLFLGCGSDHAVSPSGHVAAGTVIYGGAIALWLRKWIGDLPAAALAGGAVAALISATRLALGAHVPVEVAMGAAVGLLGIMVLLGAAGPAPSRLHGKWLVPAVAALMLVLHGTRLQAESRLRAVAGWLPGSVCAALRVE